MARTGGSNNLMGIADLTTPRALKLALPNVLTASRIAASAIALHLLRTGRPRRAALLLATGAVTDSLDGIAARRLNSVTSFGRRFDPIADRALFYATLMAMYRMRASHPVLLILVSLRELLLASGAVVALIRGVPPPGVSTEGRISTALFFSGAQLAMAGSILNKPTVRTTGNAIVTASLPFGYRSLVSYRRHAVGYGRTRV